MSQEKDKVFFRNFSLIVGVLAVMMIIFITAARFIGEDETANAKQKAAAAAKLTAPMGEVTITGEEGKAPGTGATAAPAAPATTAAAGPDGKKVFDGLCTSCHSVPGIGAPVFGNKDDWAPRIAQGKETLYKHALNGFTGPSGFMMPAKGGNPALSDDEIKAAVDYMVANSGGDASGGAAETGGTTAPVPATPTATATAGPDGKKVFDGLCTSCHSVPGIGAPVFGNKDDWAPRIAQGKETLYNHALNGFTGPSGFMMPAKGGNPALSDEEVKAAVDYMVSNSQ